MRKRAETEGKECWKKKEQEDVGHHTTKNEVIFEIWEALEKECENP